MHIALTPVERFAMWVHELSEQPQSPLRIPAPVSIDAVSDALGISHEDGGKLAGYLHFSLGWARCEFATRTIVLMPEGTRAIAALIERLGQPPWRQWVERNKAVLAWIGGSLATAAVGLLAEAVKHWIWK